MESDAAEFSLLKLQGWYKTNQKMIHYGGATVVIVGLIVWFVLWHQNEKEVNAGEALTSATMSQMPGPGGMSPDGANAYLKVASEYPKSSAGARALLMAAGDLFDTGKYEEAKAQFQRFVREYRESPLVSQALLGIASCLDAEGKTSDAVTSYKDLVDHHPGDSVVPQAKFALARLYEAQNKPELAKNMYEDVERTDPYGSLGPEAGMRVEELVLKYPSLAPKPVAPAPVIPTISYAPASNAPPLKIEKK